MILGKTWCLGSCWMYLSCVLWCLQAAVVWRRWWRMWIAQLSFSSSCQIGLKTAPHVDLVLWCTVFVSVLFTDYRCWLSSVCKHSANYYLCSSTSCCKGYCMHSLDQKSLCKKGSYLKPVSNTMYLTIDVQTWCVQKWSMRWMPTKLLFQFEFIGPMCSMAGWLHHLLVIRYSTLQTLKTLMLAWHNCCNVCRLLPDQ